MVIVPLDSVFSVFSSRFSLVSDKCRYTFSLSISILFMSVIVQLQILVAADGAPDLPRSKGFIIITKHVICPEGFVCPTASDFLMVAREKDPYAGVFYDPIHFSESETGTKLKLLFLRTDLK